MDSMKKFIFSETCFFIFLFKGKKMKLKHIVVASMAALAFASGNANALSVSSGGDLFLVAINDNTGGSFIAPLTSALSSTAAAFTSANTGSVNFSTATGFSSAWSSLTAAGTDTSAISYGVFGIDTSTNKVLSTINPTNFTSAGSNDDLLNFIQGAKTGAIGLWATIDNASVTGTTAAYRATDTADGNGITWSNFMSQALTGTSGQLTYTGSAPASLFALSTNGVGLTPMTASMFTNTFELTSAGQFTVAAVPEADTSAMMLAGLGLMGFIARRRNSKK